MLDLIYLQPETAPNDNEPSPLKAERDALAAFVAKQQEFIESVMANIGAGAKLDEVADMLCDWWDNRPTPQQCLLELQSETINDVVLYICDRTFKEALYKGEIIKLASEYADAKRKGSTN